jgi:type IV pilus assembly protein PilO
MAKISKPSIDVAALQGSLKAQFTGLDPNDPPSWPALPRYLLCVVVTIAVVVALWFVWLSSSDEELAAEQAKEVQLKDDYKKKLVQAVNLEYAEKAA